MGNVKEGVEEKKSRESRRCSGAEEVREGLFKRRLQEAATGGTIFRKKSVSSSKQRATVGAAILDGCEKSVRKERKREANRVAVCRGLVRVDKSAIDRRTVFDMGPYERNAIYMRGSKKHSPELPKVEGTRVSPHRIAKWVDVEDSDEISVLAGTGAGVLVCHGEEELALLVPRSVAAAERMVTKSRRLDDVFQALEALEAGASGSTCRNNPRCQRVVGVDGAKSKYVNVGTKSAKFGAGLTTTTAALKQKKNQRHYEAFSSWIKRLEHGVSSYLPLWLCDVTTRACDRGMPLVDASISKIWPAMVAGRNVFLNVHTDRDLVWCLTTVIAEGLVEVEDEVICYFCFPSLNVAVPLRNGDMLLFNPNVPHCVSSRCNGEKEAFCVSFYFDPLLPSENSNGHALTLEEEMADKKVLEHLG